MKLWEEYFAHTEVDAHDDRIVSMVKEEERAGACGIHRLVSHYNTVCMLVVIAMRHERYNKGGVAWLKSGFKLSFLLK